MEFEAFLPLTIIFATIIINSNYTNLPTEIPISISQKCKKVILVQSNTPSKTCTDIYTYRFALGRLTLKQTNQQSEVQ